MSTYISLIMQVTHPPQIKSSFKSSWPVSMALSINHVLAVTTIQILKSKLTKPDKHDIISRWRMDTANMIPNSLSFYYCLSNEDLFISNPTAMYDFINQWIFFKFKTIHLPTLHHQYVQSCKSY